MDAADSGPDTGSLEPQPGDRVGHYEIVERQGKGGWGEVFTARDLGLGRLVALKRPRADDPDMRRRFMREARTASSLDHPNIVPIYEVFEDAGGPWLAMQRIDGPNLREFLQREPRWSIAKVLAQAHDLADALAAAHRRRILHRDVSPRNVLVGNDERVFLIDFGLACYFTPPDERSTAPTLSAGTTPSGTVLGTPGHMSPEQALGREIDPRSDIFALGTLLYEMCTGKPAFVAPADKMLDAILHREPPPITRLNPDAPAELERIVCKAIAKDPDERYQNVRDLQADLRALSRRIGNGSRPPIPIHPPRPPVRPRIAIAAGMVALALVAWRWPEIERGLRHWWAGMHPPPYLCVGAFENLSGDASLDYLGRGISTTLLSYLGGVKGVYVLPAKPELAAPLMLEGSVQKVGRNLRIDFRLRRREPDRLLGGDVVQGSVDQIFDLEDQVARGVAQLLEHTLHAGIAYASPRPPTQDVTAYDLYLQARDYLDRLQEPENADYAIGLLEKAVGRDSSFAAGFALLGKAYWKKYELTGDPKWVPQARNCSERATRLDPDLAAAHAALGNVHRGTGDYARAERDFLRAIALDATLDDAYNGLGKVHTALGKPALAESAFKQAIELHPRYWGGHATLGRFYFRQARYAEAAAAYTQAIELCPGNAPAYLSLGGIDITMGRYEEAIDALQKSQRIRPHYAAATNLGSAYLALRRFEDAVEAYEAAIGFADATYIAFGNLARAYYWAPGHRAQAAPMFQRAIDKAEESLQVNPKDADAHILLAYYDSMLDRRDQALEHLRTALAARPEDPEFFYFAGVVHNRLGDTRTALDWLAKAVQGGYSRAEIRTNVELDNLRQTSEFKQLLQKS